MDFIKLTSFINPARGYAAGPSFEKHLWPLVLSNAEAIEKVFLFANSYWSGNKGSFEAGERVSPNIAEIGPLEWLSAKQFKEIRDRSFLTGHLNVMYQMASAHKLLPQLFELWPRPGKLSDHRADDFGLKKGETAEFAGFVESIPKDYVVATFGRNADPLCIFGSTLTLRQLMGIDELRLKNKDSNE